MLQAPGTTPQGLIGDCNGQDGVTIDEVTTVSNIFRLVQPVSDCLAADANDDGTVDVIEVQNTINNHVNGLPST